MNLFDRTVKLQGGEGERERDTRSPAALTVKRPPAGEDRGPEHGRTDSTGGATSWPLTALY